MTAAVLALALVAALPTDQQFAEMWLAYRRELLSSGPATAARLEAKPDGESQESAARLRSLVERAKSGVVPAPVMLSIAVDAVGTLRKHRLKIVQRVSASEARIEIFREPTREELRLHRKWSFELPSIDVLLKGLNLSDVADGQKIETEQCFAVTGTQTYTTALGAPRTVFVLEPFDTAKALVIYRKSIDQEKDAAQQRQRDLARRDAAKLRMKREASARTEANKYPALLKNARNLAKAGLYAAAEKKFRQIIAEAPGTPAAADAQKELDGLPAH